MAPLFAAYDCTAYHQPAFAFAVIMLGMKGHAVALDEAHEMCINKDMKQAIVHPSKPYLFRIATYKNLQLKLFPSSVSNEPKNTVIYSDDPQLKKEEENIVCYD